MKINPDARWPFIITAALISVAVILTSGLFDEPDVSGYTLSQYMNSQYNVVKARVLSVDDSHLSPDPYIEGMRIGTQLIEIEITGGPHRGEVFSTPNPMSRAFNVELKPGMAFLCLITEEDGIVSRVDVYGYSRESTFFWLLAVFCAVVLFVGRKKGLYSMVSLIFTLIIMLFFLIPRIIEGHNPILMAIIAATLTTVVSMLTVSGFNSKSLSAIMGIVLGVAAAALIGVIAGNLGNISGINAQESAEMISLARDVPIKVRELFFAGIIIAALGAIMDVGMSISSAVFEIKAANPKLGRRELYRSGMNIGRDIIGTMTNTLILAFTGSSMAVIIIITLYRLPFFRMINLDIVGLEIIQGVAGSIGLILTVPITAICAAFFSSSKVERRHK